MADYQKRVIAIAVLMFFMVNACAPSHTPTNAQHAMAAKSDYPKIERYSEVDLGDPNAGSQTWTLADGQKVYGGAADHNPHIKRRTITLNEEQKNDLLNQKLTFLPYFKEQKPVITLEQYFLACTGTKREFKKLFPMSLDGLYSQKDDEYFNYFSTRLQYEKNFARNLTVIWLSPSVWYLDEVYYRADDMDKLIEKGQSTEEIIMEGALADFLRLSPIVQQKLNEGFSELTPKTERPVIKLNDLVFSYQLTPGMPNTTSFAYDVWSDGTIKQAGGITQQADYNFVTELLLKSLRLDWKQYEQESSGLQPHAHDRQSVILTIWYEGRDYRLINPYITSRLPLENFRDFALKHIQTELSSGK